jgi:hypothetical protein
LRWWNGTRTRQSWAGLLREESGAALRLWPLWETFGGADSLRQLLWCIGLRLKAPAEDEEPAPLPRGAEGGLVCGPGLWACRG